MSTVPRNPGECDISFLGGGPTNGVPAAYLLTFDVVFEGIDHASEWSSWWSSAGQGPCGFAHDFRADDDDDLMTARECRIGVDPEEGSLHVDILRRTGSLHTAADGSPTPSTAEVVKIAYEDIAHAFEALRATYGLADHPAFVDLDLAAEAVALRLESREASVAPARALVAAVRDRLTDQTREMVDDALANEWGVGLVLSYLEVATELEGLTLSAEEVDELNALRELE